MRKASFESFLGIYLKDSSQFFSIFSEFSGDYLNDKPYYYDPVSKFYLYYYEQYGSWQMNYRPGTEMAWYYGYSDPAFPCPTGNDESWMEWKNDQWVPMEDFRIYAA